jgi:pimeloyl-ACP methyl ester carboxylesterase
VRIVWRGLFFLIVLAVLIVASAFGYRGWRQHEIARTLAIETKNGISEASFIRIGGLDQWIQIRGDDRNNPVVLMVHGGPGNSMGPFTQLFRPWEKHFTVVQWDQRGSGKTYGRHGTSGQGAMTIDRMAQDGIEVASYLRRYLRKDKIIVLAHSWGTVLGVKMVKERPELFSAYVGTGQVVAKEEKEEIIYAALMKKVRAANDLEAIKELDQIGAPPFASQEELLVQRKISSRYDIPSERDIQLTLAPVVLFDPNYSVVDIWDFLASPSFAGSRIYAELVHYDARTLGLRFDVPFFLFQGESDAITPTDLARAYFDTIEAPVKAFVVFNDAGHSAMLTNPDAFLGELLGKVRPLTAESVEQ